MAPLDLRIPDKETVLDKLARLPSMGRSFTPRTNHSCRMCRRSIGKLGRLPYPGFPICTHDDCALTSLSSVTTIFPAAYGCAVHLGILGVIGKVVEVDNRVFLQRKPLVKRASILAEAYIDLIAWQLTYDLYERMSAPTRYRQGRIQLVPPRRIDEVIALRSITDPVPINPTRRLPGDVQQTLKRMKKMGAEGFELPF